MTQQPTRGGDRGRPSQVPSTATAHRQRIDELDALFARWGVCIGRFRARRRELATVLADELVACSWRLDDELMREFFDELELQGVENKPAKVAEVLEDTDGRKHYLADLAGRAELRRRRRARYGHVGPLAPGEAEHRARDETHEAQRRGMTLSEFQHRERCARAAATWRLDRPGDWRYVQHAHGIGPEQARQFVATGLEDEDHLDALRRLAARYSVDLEAVGGDRVAQWEAVWQAQRAEGSRRRRAGLPPSFAGAPDRDGRAAVAELRARPITCPACSGAGSFCQLCGETGSVAPVVAEEFTRRRRT